MTNRMHKCLLHVDFLAGPNDGHQGFARLKIELPFCPTTDVELEHPTWLDACAPVRVSYNFATHEFYVVMPTEEVGTIENVKLRKDIYSDNGWTVS